MKFFYFHTIEICWTNDQNVLQFSTTLTESSLLNEKNRHIRSMFQSLNDRKLFGSKDYCEIYIDISIIQFSGTRELSAKG